MNKNFLLPDGIRRGARRAMTLVEVMASLAVFGIVILGTLTMFNFSLSTVDDSRAFTRITQILNHEMEAMRLRGWSDRSVTTPGGPVVMSGLDTLAGGSGITDFIPFAIYGETPPSGQTVATIGKGVEFTDEELKKNQAKPPMGAATNLRFTRTLTRDASTTMRSINVMLKADWTDSHGKTHTRSIQSKMSENGLNKYVYDGTIQIQ